jgi:hypothetical protein
MACGQAGQFPKQSACVIRNQAGDQLLIPIIRDPVEEENYIETARFRIARKASVTTVQAPIRTCAPLSRLVQKSLDTYQQGLGFHLREGAASLRTCVPLPEQVRW